MKTKVVFFDLYQTLINVDAANEKSNTKLGFETVIAPYLREKGISEADALLVLAHYSNEVQTFYRDNDIKQDQHNFRTILITVFDKYYRIAASDKEINDLIYEFRKISRGYLRIYDGVSEMLEAMSQNYTLIVASHTQGVYTERELEDLGIRKYFKHCVYSSDIGYKKTANAFYQKCLEISGLKAKDCVMVGDNLSEDVSMAHQNGIHTVWVINPLTKDMHPVTVAPDAQIPIESIENLPNVVKTLWNS
jgi:putative hydrolase of the HAD superfamily